MKRSLVYLFAVSLVFTQCETLGKIPTNTSGTFSLNGTWRLETTNDNNALTGTTVTVVPGVTDANVKALQNNNYCLRERDIIWRNLKVLDAGGFSLENLVNACEGTPLYRNASIMANNNDEIRLNGSKASGGELVQTWRRVLNE